MRATSATYKTLRTQTGAFYEVEVIRGATTYDINDLVSIRINPKLFDGSGPSIGNAYSSACTIKLMESSANWPRMAEFSIRIRLSSADGLTKSEWLPMGTYYTDTRKEEKNGFLIIEAFDGMLLNEQYWPDQIDPEDMPSTWPITSKAWIDMIEDAGLIEVDSRSVIDDTVPLVGLNTGSTIRDCLKTIAAANGGNWVMTFEGKLRLVPLYSIVEGQEAIAGIAIAGIAIVGFDGSVLPGGIGTDNIGLNAQAFDNSPALTGITGVHLETEVGSSSDAGTNTGYVLDAICNFSSSAGVASLCLGNVSGYIYKPFSATKATLDPATEPGDIVIIDGISYQMMNINWNINTWPVADISAAFEEEVNHEYYILDESAKTLRKALSTTLEEASSLIEQTAEEITLSVTQNYYTKEDVDEIQRENESSFALTSQQIQAALSQITTLNGEVEEINYYIRYEVIDGVGTVIVGQTNSLAELHITNGQISMIYNGEEVTYWNQSKQYTPKQLQIPVGGSFRLGNILWQPRSSGNLSVFLVNS